MDQENTAGTAMAATFLAINVLSAGKGGSLERKAGEQLTKRFNVTAGKTIAPNITMADWLAEAKNGSRGIVMEVFTGNNKSVTTVRKQLEAGMDYLNSRGVKNVAPYVMVNSQKAAARIRKELGRVRGWDVNVIVGP